MYYIYSHIKDEISPKALADTIRGHWTIENKLHYRKDRTLDEDRSQVRGKSIARIMSMMRNLAIHSLCPNSPQTLPQMQNILLANLGTAVHMATKVTDLQKRKNWPWKRR